MTMFAFFAFTCISILVFPRSIICGMSDDVDPGFNIYIGETNMEEMQEKPITFYKPLPKWLKGTLIRIGPGRYELGQRQFGHLFDVFGKLHSWRFYGDGRASYTTKLIQSDFYKSCNKTGELVQALLLAPTVPPMKFNLTEFERLQFLYKGIDNPTRNVYNLTGNCVAIGSSFQLNILDCYNLESVMATKPSIPKTDLRFPFWIKHVSPHMVKEYGTQFHIGVVVKISVLPFVRHQILVTRVYDLAHFKVLAEIPVENAPFIQSFSATEKFAIVYVSPYYINVQKYQETLILNESLEFSSEGSSYIYVVDIKSGTYTTLKTKSGFIMHHINAYEISNSSMFVDVCLYESPDILKNYNLATLTNKTRRDRLKWRPKVTRMTLDLKQKSVLTSTFNNSDKVPYSAELEFPVINEQYRFRKYCYIYGIVFAKNDTVYAQWKIVKKNICDDSPYGDLQFDIPSIYPAEVTFVPDPTGSKEDDGYLLMPAFNTENNSSALIIIDARSMLINNSALLPTFVPFTLHGRMFIFT